jgi:virginiamycin B lyase
MRESMFGVVAALAVLATGSGCAQTWLPDAAARTGDYAVSAGLPPARAPSKRGQITLYPLTFGDPVPMGITAGPDGAMWFSDQGNSEVGRITMQGAITEYPLALAGPNGIASGPDGALWFAATAGFIGRVTTGGKFTTYGDEKNRYPQQITTGPDGALWFTEYGRIGRITTAGSITHVRIANRFTQFGGITTGPDGALWFTETVRGGSHFSNKIHRFAQGARSEYVVGSGPEMIVAGPDHALWFTELAAQKIGRLTTAGKFTEFPLPENVAPLGIAVGPDGALWFTATSRNGYIGRMTLAGKVTLYPISGSAPQPQQIAAGPDGAMWFTDLFPFAIGRITTR